MMPAKRFLEAFAKSIKGSRKADADDLSFSEALTRTAEQILRETREVASLSHVVWQDADLAVFLVVNEVVQRASNANVGNTIGRVDDREVADLTFFCLQLPAVCAEMKAAGVSVDPARIASFHLSGVVGASMGREAATHAISRALGLAYGLIGQTSEHPSVKPFIETLWDGIRAFAWSGDRKTLAFFESAYLLFVQQIWPTRSSRPASAADDSLR